MPCDSGAPCFAPRAPTRRACGAPRRKAGRAQGARPSGALGRAPTPVSKSARRAKRPPSGTPLRRRAITRKHRRAPRPAPHGHRRKARRAAIPLGRRSATGGAHPPVLFVRPACAPPTALLASWPIKGDGKANTPPSAHKAGAEGACSSARRDARLCGGGPTGRLCGRYAPAVRAQRAHTQ